MLKYVLFRFIHKRGGPFHVPRDQQYGGPIDYNTYEEVEKSFAEGKVVSEDLKVGIIHVLIEAIKPLREILLKNAELEKNAYPPVITKKNKNANQQPPLSASALDLRVGKVESVKAHDKNDKLLVYTVDLGTEKRTLISGPMDEIKSHDDFRGTNVIVLANIGDRESDGVVSQGKIVIACSQDKKTKSFVKVPGGTEIGDRIVFEGETGESEQNISKNRLEKIMKQFKIKEGIVFWKDLEWNTQAGVCTSLVKEGVLL